MDRDAQRQHDEIARRDLRRFPLAFGAWLLAMGLMGAAIVAAAVVAQRHAALHELVARPFLFVAFGGAALLWPLVALGLGQPPGHGMSVGRLLANEVVLVSCLITGQVEADWSMLGLLGLPLAGVLWLLGRRAPEPT